MMLLRGAQWGLIQPLWTHINTAQYGRQEGEFLRNVGGGLLCYFLHLCVWGGALDLRQCHSQSPSTLSHDSSQLAVSSSFLLLKAFWQAPNLKDSTCPNTLFFHLFSFLCFYFSTFPNSPPPPSSLYLPSACPCQLIDLCQYWMSETRSKMLFGPH